MSPPPKEAEPQPSAKELRACRELVLQAPAAGAAWTGPGGLLIALTETAIATALEDELRGQHILARWAAVRPRPNEDRPAPEV